MGRSTSSYMSSADDHYSSALFWAQLRGWSTVDRLRLLHEAEAEVEYHQQQQQMVDAFRRHIGFQNHFTDFLDRPS